MWARFRCSQHGMSYLRTKVIEAQPVPGMDTFLPSPVGAVSMQELTPPPFSPPPLLHAVWLHQRFPRHVRSPPPAPTHHTHTSKILKHRVTKDTLRRSLTPPPPPLVYTVVQVRVRRGVAGEAAESRAPERVSGSVLGAPRVQGVVDRWWWVGGKEAEEAGAWQGAPVGARGREVHGGGSVRWQR